MIVFPLLAASATLILTGWVRRYALERALLDSPNHRSLHADPTPRGGGVVIVIAVLGYLLYALLSGLIDRSLGVALAGGGLVVAAVGFIDDVRSLSAGTRLAFHFAAATWAVVWLGGLPSINVGFASMVLGVAGGVAAVVLVVWTTNLYNFMDGIDGLAGVEAVFVAGCGGLLLLSRSQVSAATLAFVVCGAAAGFLYWNWAPARIFMGDVGSGFLGFTFGVLALWSENSGALPLLIWFILASVFFLDASITIVRRLPGGRWRHAHRSHAYQRAVISGQSHSRVVLAVTGYNLLLAGLAAIALVRPSTLLLTALVSVVLGGILYIAVGRMQPFVLEHPPA